jgi:hypothetical protein
VDQWVRQYSGRSQRPYRPGSSPTTRLRSSYVTDASWAPCRSTRCTPGETGIGLHIQSFREVVATIRRSGLKVHCTLVLGRAGPAPASARRGQPRHGSPIADRHGRFIDTGTALISAVSVVAGARLDILVSVAGGLPTHPPALGRVAQWESARFTRERSQVRNPPRPSSETSAFAEVLRFRLSGRPRRLTPRPAPWCPMVANHGARDPPYVMAQLGHSPAFTRGRRAATRTCAAACVRSRLRAAAIGRVARAACRRATTGRITRRICTGSRCKLCTRCCMGCERWSGAGAARTAAWSRSAVEERVRG